MQFDDAALRQPRHFMTLMDHQLDRLVHEQASKAFLNVPSGDSQALTENRDDQRHFYSNNDIWEAIIGMGFKSPTARISLDSFFLFEWFPRVPGLYHTEDGKWARMEAQQNIELEGGVRVYNPYGKMSMLDGGIGTLRLKPVSIDGQDIYLMSASSDGFPDHGFPIGLPELLYGDLIDEILERGCVARSIFGRLRYLPERFSSMYRDYRNIPEVYLLVDSIERPSHQRRRSMEEFGARVAVSFSSSYEGMPKIYAAYVTFDPGVPGSFERSLDWLENDYVHNKYRGQVITDFDEQKGHFASAPFSLRKIMSLNLRLDEVSNTAGIDRYYAQRILSVQDEIRIYIGEINVNTFNISGGTQGAVGPNARADNFNQYSGMIDQVDLERLRHDLALLRTEARARATTADQDAAVRELADAETAAAKGDKSGIIRHLSQAGTWILDLASKISVPVAEALIKSMLR